MMCGWCMLLGVVVVCLAMQIVCVASHNTSNELMGVLIGFRAGVAYVGLPF